MKCDKCGKHIPKQYVESHRNFHRNKMRYVSILVSKTGRIVFVEPSMNIMAGHQDYSQKKGRGLKHEQVSNPADG